MAIISLFIKEKEEDFSNNNYYLEEKLILKENTLTIACFNI